MPSVEYDAMSGKYTKILLRRLASAGVSIDEEKIQEAVNETLAELISENSAVDQEIRARVEALSNSFELNRATFLELKHDLELTRVLAAKRRRQQITLYMMVAMVAGLTSATASLILGFEPFIDAIRKIIGQQSLFHFVPTAFASTGGGAVPVQITPVIVYGIYLLLAVSYVASVAGRFLASDAKKQAFCEDTFKHLTAFFIGSVSGKFV